MKRLAVAALLVLIAIVVRADVIDLNVTIDECGGALLIIGPFTTEDNITPALPDTLGIQVDTEQGPPSDPPLLTLTTITPLACAPTCVTPTGVVASCDPATGVCNMFLPGRVNKVTHRNKKQPEVLCTIQWTWAPNGRGVELVEWTVQRSTFLQPPC